MGDTLLQKNTSYRYRAQMLFWSSPAVTARLATDASDPVKKRVACSAAAVMCIANIQ